MGPRVALSLGDRPKSCVCVCVCARVLAYRQGEIHMMKMDVSYQRSVLTKLELL